MAATTQTSVDVTFTAITNPSTQLKHTFSATATVIAITNWLLHQLQQCHTEQCNLLLNGLVLHSTQTLEDIANGNTHIQLQYFLSNQLTTHNDTPISTSSSTLPPAVNTALQLPSNDNTSLLNYYTQLQQQHPTHYNMLLTQYPYLQQQIDNLRNPTTTTTTTSTTPQIQHVNVQPQANNQPAVPPQPVQPVVQQNNVMALFNVANLWRFLHIQLILKISILLFLFCQNGDIYRTVLMCIVAAIAYLYQVGAFGRAAQQNGDGIDEDGFEVIPDNVRQQAERDENARRQRAENAANGVVENQGDELPPSMLLNTEKFIVGLIASLWPDWQPHVLMPHNRGR